MNLNIVSQGLRKEGSYLITTSSPNSLSMYCLVRSSLTQALRLFNTP